MKKHKEIKYLIRGLRPFIKDEWRNRINKYPFRHIWYFFILLFGCGVVLYLEPRWYTWVAIKWVIWVLLAIFVLFLLCKPMNPVYGLIGTKGNIRTYVALLILINLIFSIIYHFTFFKDAGITYDINQPYISYGMFTGEDCKTRTFEVKKKVYIYDLKGKPVSYTENSEEHNYQKVELMYVVKNTFMTSLMQEPSDFFAIASTYNQAVDKQERDIVGYKDSCCPICCCKKCSCRMRVESDYVIHKEGRDKEKSELFHWLLILQVFISWIFFGVFISILYNKFRYES